MSYKIFDKVWVKIGSILFPAVVWDVDTRKEISDSNGNVVDSYISVLIVINGICLPRSFLLSKLIDARSDVTFSFSTVKQLKSISVFSQTITNEKYEIL